MQKKATNIQTTPTPLSEFGILLFRSIVTQTLNKCKFPSCSNRARFADPPSRRL